MIEDDDKRKILGDVQESHYVEDLCRKDNVNQFVQKLIDRYKSNPAFDVGQISDGYHTFNELYHHRQMNYIVLCKLLKFLPGSDYFVWKSNAHSNGEVWEGWFLLGIGTKPGEQITYHLQSRY